MITQQQYESLGPLGREIIDHDRQRELVRYELAQNAIIRIDVGHLLRDADATRLRLTRAAATLCNSGSADRSPTGPRAASLGRR